MKNHKDLLHVLRVQGKKITPVRSLMLQYILDNQEREISLSEFYCFLKERFIASDKSSVYRNLELFKRLDIIYEVNSGNNQKKYKYVFDVKLHPFFICKSCGQIVNLGGHAFEKIQDRMISLLSEEGLSAIFYGYCGPCRGKLIGGVKSTHVHAMY